jgi:hypothetical protein
MRMAIGLLGWVAAGMVLWWWLNGYLFAPQADGHRVATDLWQFASAERRMVKVQFDESWPVEVGDPIYRVDGPDAIEQVGEIRRILPPGESAAPGTPIGPAAEALLYPSAPRICVESCLTYYTTPTSLGWVLETMLPPDRRVQIAQEIVATYEAYHAEILRALKPVIIGGLVDAMQVVEEDLAEAVSRRRESLERLGSRYQDHVVEREIVPLIRDQIWPIVKKHAEPLANQVGEEMFQRASLWRFGWRFLYDSSPLPEKNLTRTEWNRFMNEEGMPVLNSHANDIVAAQRLILEEVANNERVRDALRRNLSRVIDDPEFRAIVWEIFREALIDNPRLRKKLEERWSGEEARQAVQLAADYTEPCVRRIGDLLFGTREEGIAPEFAQVLRNQILDKDCRWLVLETPAHARPLEETSGHSDSVLRVRTGGYPQVNPFAVQLQGVRP